jgi:hypothetical protein
LCVSIAFLSISFAIIGVHPYQTNPRANPPVPLNKSTNCPLNGIYFAIWYANKAGTALPI